MTQATGNITGDILLESGTNEFEVLTFHLGGFTYGVNVAKVREVIQPQPVIDIPNKHNSVIGLFTLRNTTLTLIDLGKHLGMTRGVDRAALEATTEIDDAMHQRSIIVTEFNNVRIGFLVDSVDRIHRMTWEHMLPIPPMVFRMNTEGTMISSVTGAINIDNRLILMVDFESVADSILMERKLACGSVDNPSNVDRGSKVVVMAEDSPFMRQQIRNVMIESGYTKVEIYSDGQDAWEAISQPGRSKIDAVVSDIEMPRLDGLALTRQIKQTAALRDIPVVLFSSLISEDNANKGRTVGASVQIPKPELPDLVHLVDRIVTGQPIEGHIRSAITLNKTA